MPLLPAKKLLDNFRCWLHADDGKENMSAQGIRVVKLPNHELMETVRSLTRQGLQTLFPIRGRSMRIFVEDGRDKAILAPFDPARLKKGDVVLAWVAEGYYVLHRIVLLEGDLLTLMGDGNVHGTEHCKRSDVIAKAIGFVRKGRNETDWTTGWKWTVYSWIWTRMLPLRRWLLLAWLIRQRISAH